MAGRAEEIYKQLQTREGVISLIGAAEDAHLDCKEWPAKDEDAQRLLAKAACGLTNADGGVLVIGMSAESRPKDEPDVITAAAPVADTSLVKSRTLGLLSSLVEPGIIGIEAIEVPDRPRAKSGFVVIYIPKSEGSPRRSRKDWKFYQRIGSASLPMEYWQIEDMFGKRPHPQLAVVEITESLHSTLVSTMHADRRLVVTVANSGKSLARFPAFRCRRGPVHFSNGPFDGVTSIWTPSYADPDWWTFRGSANDVLYPGESLQVATLYQRVVRGNVPDQPAHAAVFPSFTLSTEVLCDSLPAYAQEFTIAEAAMA